MRNLVYEFSTFEQLSTLLERSSQEQELVLPEASPTLADGQWLIADFTVGCLSTSLAACALDTGEGLRIVFERRDWEQLLSFAERCRRASLTSVPPPAKTSPEAARLLVIDSDPDTREVLTQLLTQQGYSTEEADSAEQAFDILRERLTDLLILDISLPGMSGLDFCRRLRREARLRSLPVIFLTGHAIGSAVVEAFEAGADDYMTKPFTAPELSARIFGLLKRARLEAPR